MLVTIANLLALVGGVQSTLIDLRATTPLGKSVLQSTTFENVEILGGDSAVNGLVWVRGAREEYDAFADLGNPGWNWDNFYSAMKKAENLERPSQELTDEFGFVVEPSSLGSAGPLNVSFPAFLPLQHQKFINASIELGHDFNSDAYNGSNKGVFYSLSSEVNSSVRVTAEFAYADPVIARENLVILYNGALATSLNITGTGIVQASGVYVRFPDDTIQYASVKSTGEVILSAGTIRTPQLLELSGVGDKNILNPLKIDVKVDLPGVGANYMDHTITILTYLLKEPYESFDALSYDLALKAEQEKLYKEGKGWFTFANGVVNMSPVDNILSLEEIAIANQILETKPPTVQQDLFESIKSMIFKVPQAEYLLFNSFSGGPVKEANRSYVSMAVTHLHPLSRGSIHIDSSSIDDLPLINPNVLESDWDRWFLAKATAYGRKFFNTQSFQAIFEKEVFPTGEVPLVQCSRSKSRQMRFPAANVSTDTQWEAVCLLVRI
ncbi:hypothetical protein C0992_007021 [Termitomyces sp. T32_za158]|nr:hypothetical protein C0992_007021 [Termitomyces sp. T32_za158]